MPVALDPEATLEIVLESDRGKDPEPTFVFRYLAAREWQQIAAVGDRMDQVADDDLDGMMDTLIDTIAIPLCAWHHLREPTGDEVPYDPDRIGYVLSPQEIQELIFAYMAESQLGVADKKKSASPAPSAQAPSAPTADRPTPAGTAPAPTNQPSSNAPAATEPAARAAAEPADTNSSDAR